MTTRKRGGHNRQRTPPTRVKQLANTNKSVSRWTCIALITLAVLPYLQTLGYQFVNFDDGAYVAENPIVRQGLTWSGIAWAWTTMSSGNWHPLTWLSHMIDCQIFGLRPGWHHLMNTLLHGANTALVFLVLGAMTGMMWRSALVAALFAVHPIHVESVAWIAERKDLLSTAFGLLGIWAYANYTAAPSMQRYGLVAGLFALSLLSKPMWVTFPFLLLLLDVWPLHRIKLDRRRQSQSSHRVERTIQDLRPAQLFLEKVPLLVMSAASSVVTFKAQHAAGAVAPIDVLPLSQRLANAITAYVGYLGKTFWPVDLAVIYPLQVQASVAKTMAALLVLAGITIGVTMLIRRRPSLAVGWLWFLGMLVPVIGLVQVGSQSMADRYTYVPLIGVFILIAWSLPSANGVAIRSGRIVAISISAAVVLTALLAITFLQVQTWKHSVALFDHAVRVTRGNFMAHNLLASAFGQQGDLVRAQDETEKALRIRSNYAGAHYNLGKIMLQQRDFAKAKEQFSLALQTDQKDPMTWNALAVANSNLGLTDEAVSNCEHALALNPNYPDAFANLGRAFLIQGKVVEAIEKCEAALKLRPDIAEAHASLGAALLKRGRSDESILHSGRALALDPSLIEPRINLSAALIAKGNYDEAIAHLEEVVRVNPQDKVAQKLLNEAKQKRNGAITEP